MSYEFRTPLTSIGGFAELLQGGVAGELSAAGAGLCRGDPRFGRAALAADRNRARPDPERGRAAADRHRGSRPAVVRHQRRARARRRDRGPESHARPAGRQERRVGRRPTSASSAGRSATSSTTPLPRCRKAGASSSRLSRGKQGARIVISDNGPGMKPSELARALEGYRHRRRRQARGAARQGLGLPLARQLIEAHGGAARTAERAGRRHDRHDRPAVTIDLPDLAAMERSARGSPRGCKPGDVVALAGDLGTGKTTLARAVIAALGHAGEVPSPTFTIVETYDAPRSAAGPCRFLPPRTPGRSRTSWGSTTIARARR